MAFDESDQATWCEAPAGYEFLTVDHVTGELHLFAPDGRNVSDASGPHRADLLPDAVVNAVIVRAMLDHALRPEYADRAWYAWCDMTPRVVDWMRGPTDPEYCPDDVWWVDVQYSSKGARAAYGVNRNHVPTCYAD